MSRSPYTLANWFKSRSRGGQAAVVVGALGLVLLLIACGAALGYAACATRYGLGN